MDLTALTPDQIQIFLLVFVRVTAILVLLPVLGANSVPMKVKAGLSLLLTILVYPQVTMAEGSGGLSSISLFTFSVLKEACVGLVIGYTTLFLFAAVQFAGIMVDRQMGFAMVQLLDPMSNSESSVTGQLHVLLFSIIFLLLNGHYFLILAVQKSFELIPLFGVKFATGSLASFFSSMVGNLFELSLRFAAPVFIILVLASAALGIVARTVPQLNIFFVGLPLKIGLGLVATIMVLPLLAHMFQGIMKSIIEDVWNVLYLMA